jgi:hypothetical protein
MPENACCIAGCARMTEFSIGLSNACRGPKRPEHNLQRVTRRARHSRGAKKMPSGKIRARLFRKIPTIFNDSASNSGLA